MRKVIEFLLKKYVHLNYVKVGYTIRICEKDSSTGGEDGDNPYGWWGVQEFEIQD